ncbi:hypothetical protein JCM10212_001854 [Sporobolomyces blumeae]
MHRAVRQVAVLHRTFATSSCSCQSASSSSSSSASSPYSLPHDAFSTPSTASSPSSTSAASSSSLRPPHSTSPLSRTSSSSTPTRQRQKQYLTDSEAQAFADLLGEILPRSLASSQRPGSLSGDQGGMLDLFNPDPAASSSKPPASLSTSGEGPDLPDRATLERNRGVVKVQEALRRKMYGQYGRKPGASHLVAARGELLPEEELELDRLREEMLRIRDDRELVEWGLTNVFGFDPDRARTVFVDPVELPVEPRQQQVARRSPSRDKPTTTTTTEELNTRGPSSRIFPELLLHLFLVLRDTHGSPHTALSMFSLAASNPYSYINGCTAQLYVEVLRTRWSEGDVENVLSGIDEMERGGVQLDDRVKDLVSAIGESIRLDRERTEVAVKLLEARGAFRGPLDEGECEREVQKRRVFSDRQIKAWRRMERIIEETQDELERQRREKKEEQFRMDEAALDRRERDRARGDRFDSTATTTTSSVEARDSFGTMDRDQGRVDVPNEYERPSLSARRGDPFDLFTRPGLRGAARSPTSTRTTDRPRDLSPMDNVPFAGGGERDRPIARRPREEWQDGVASESEPRQEMASAPTPRPSAMNPYKIRRQGLTREEKSARDAKHPLLFWKKSSSSRR